MGLRRCGNVNGMTKSAKSTLTLPPLLFPPLASSTSCLRILHPNSFANAERLLVGIFKSRANAKITTKKRKFEWEIRIEVGDLSGRYTQSKCKVSGEVKVLESGYKSHAKTARRNGKGKMRLLLIRIINASKTCDVGRRKGEVQKYTQFDWEIWMGWYLMVRQEMRFDKTYERVWHYLKDLTRTRWCEVQVPSHEVTICPFLVYHNWVLKNII